MGFEPTISAGERPQTYALDRAATGTGIERQITGPKLDMCAEWDMCVGMTRSYFGVGSRISVWVVRLKVSASD